MFRQSLQRLIGCVNDPLARRIGLGIGVAFVLFYLYSLGNIVIAPGVDLALGRPVPSASVAHDWTAKAWKPIAPFVWEPVAALYPIRSLALFIAVPNLLLALLLGILVGLNIAVAVARLRLVLGFPNRRGLLRGLFASLPALLTGFTCCVPTIVLALGSLAAGFTVAAITIAPYLLPVAAIALLGNLFWGLCQFSCTLPAAPEQKKVMQLIHKRNKERRHNHAF